MQLLALLVLAWILPVKLDPLGGSEGSKGELVVSVRLWVPEEGVTHLPGCFFL